MNKQSTIKHFTRGGQTFLHNFRMFNQILGRALLVVALVCVVINGMIFYVTTSPYQRYVTVEWIGAHLVVKLNDRATKDFVMPSGKSIKIYTKDLLTDPAIQKITTHVCAILFYTLLISIGLSILFFLGLSAWLKWRGRRQTEDKHLRGDTLVESNELIQAVKKNNQRLSPYKINTVPLPERAEYANIFLHGSIGTGKSETIKQLLDQIRQAGDRAIILDKGCDFIRYFYRYESDVLLNALDERGVGWDLWVDCQHPAHFDALAAALIPMPSGAGVDPFWINAARTIFSACAFEMRNDPDRSTLKLLKVILTTELDKISDLLRGTEAESLVSDKLGKTAISIKSVLATYLKSLKYLRDHENYFSIRRWIEDETQKNWLFITSKSDVHDTLKPLISGWLDIAANALTSLTPSRERRIWIILDELPSLHQLPCLSGALAEARKFGGAFVLGMQSVAQLRKLYGHDGAEELSGLCNTRVFYRTPTSETASWVSKELGQAEIDEVKENFSYGENSMRAGISVSHQTTQRYIVNYSEIMALPDLSCYLRLPGEYPVAKLKMAYCERKPNNSAFIAYQKPMSPDEEHVDHLVTSYQAQLPWLTDDNRVSAEKLAKLTKDKPKTTTNKKKSTQRKNAQDIVPPGLDLIDLQPER